MTTSKFLRILAVFIDCAVPAVVTLTQFPFWVSRGSTETVSGIALVMLILACIPFWRRIKEYFKSPDAVVLWLILFIGAMAFESIIHQIITIAFFGLIANAVGKVIYHLSRRIENSHGSDTNE